MLSKRILHKLADICSGLASSRCLVCVVAVCVCARVSGIVHELQTPSPLLPAACWETEFWQLRKRQSRKTCQAIWNLSSALTSFLHCVIHFKKILFCFVDCRDVSHLKKWCLSVLGRELGVPKDTSLLLLSMGCGCSPWSQKSPLSLTLGSWRLTRVIVHQREVRKKLSPLP